MEFKSEVISYISGKKFHSGLKLRISKKESSILSRAEYIENIIENKNILHLGCTDHISLIKVKIDKGIWFHKQLLDRANICLGIDIDKEAIEYLNSLGYGNIIHLDITKNNIPESIKQNKWDYMVLGEILEHVDNPVDFLKTIANRYAGIVERLIVTVPNAFRIDNFKYCLKHFEVINTDHRYWFTPYTLAKVITQSDMTVENFEFVQAYPLSRTAIVSNYLLKNYPPFRDAIIMITRIHDIS